MIICLLSTILGFIFGVLVGSASMKNCVGKDSKEWKDLEKAVADLSLLVKNNHTLI